MEETNEKIAEVKKEVASIIDLNHMEELVNDSQKEFEFDKITYRVKKPSFKQKQEVYQTRLDKYLELLKETKEDGTAKHMTEDDLKAMYLKRGIDIDALAQKITNLNKEKENIMLKIGKGLKEKASDLELDSFKKEVEEINDEIIKTSMKKTSLLEPSIEQQAIIVAYAKLTYLLTERKEEDKWVPAWATYDDFLNSNEALINVASYYATIMNDINLK